MADEMIAQIDALIAEQSGYVSRQEVVRPLSGAPLRPMTDFPWPARAPVERPDLSETCTGRRAMLLYRSRSVRSHPANREVLANHVKTSRPMPSSLATASWQ
jgi:hypothetical protein